MKKMFQEFACVIILLILFWLEPSRAWRYGILGSIFIVLLFTLKIKYDIISAFLGSLNIAIQDWTASYVKKYEPDRRVVR